ncbi:Non-catalytic module family EXPN protein [Mycena belliarum]|uniref:Non-catalytic module family EXPN protein n=1 Tax=Mycena belliarum TaxID=1033014 RepID=A0AAD6TXR0_9AGAR|nr:Non-catalytic module family EXPN protein [Mycena belliae]
MKLATFSAFVSSIAVVRAATSGQATWYQPNGGEGACGRAIQNGDLALALTTANYAGGENCGRRVKVQYNGKSIDAVVMDECPGCQTNGLDLTEGTFQRLSGLDAGVIQVTWTYE